MAARKKRAPQKAPARRAGRAAATRSTRKANKSIQLAAPHLLVLQLDSEKLRADGLDLARLAGFVKDFYPQDRLAIIEGTTTKVLLERLGSLDGHRNFETVLVIAHSNENGVRTAADRADPWGTFATWLKPFRPRRLVLVACDAGRWPAAADLFSGIPSLREIFASPVRVELLQGAVMLLLPFLKNLTQEQRLLIQGIHMAGTGGQLRYWKRADANNPDGIILDLLAQAVHPAIKELHKALVGLNAKR